MSTNRAVRLTKSQLKSLLWAKRKYTDNRVPPFVFRDYRTPKRLIEDGLIEYWIGYGCTMYRFTAKGLEVVESA